MTIRHLTVFAAVAEQGSMSLLPNIFITSQLISQAVRELEAHYNGNFSLNVLEKALSHRTGRASSSPMPVK